MTDMLDTLSWNAIKRELKRKKCTPILSQQIGFSDLFAENVISLWANEIGYPLADHTNLTRVAQFLQARSHNANIPKDEYLEFLKQQLLRQRREEWVGRESYLDKLENDLGDLTVSQVVTDLGYLKFSETQPDHPLQKLAALDMPLYLTTSPHDFIEMALRSMGKEPQTVICNWQEPTQPPNNLTPSVDTPLVYHLHGHDSDPPSLVLTEDDHFDFLVNITKNFDIAIPNSVKTALITSSLVLLGFQLLSWEFRVIFRGLINEKEAKRRPTSVSIQLLLDDLPNPDSAKEFIRQYFKGHEFELYWGDMDSFIQRLWEETRPL